MKLEITAEGQGILIVATAPDGLSFTSSYNPYFWKESLWQHIRTLFSDPSRVQLKSVRVVDRLGLSPFPCPTPLEDLAVKRGQGPIERLEVPEKPECQK